MSANLIVVSRKDEDMTFAEVVASTNESSLVQALEADEIRESASWNPETVLFMDGDEESLYEATREVVARHIKPERVFVITDKSLSSYPYLFRDQLFGNHLVRRYQDPASKLISRLMAAALAQGAIASAESLQSYFEPKVSIQTILIKRSIHKRAAIEAIQNYLTKVGMGGRLAALVAQATDEIIMNALFDAPVFLDGEALRRKVRRDADFELTEKEQVRIQVASADGYLGIGVGDQFGSLKRKAVMETLRKNFEKSQSEEEKVPSAGMGLNGIIQSGLSLWVVSKPRVFTEVMLFAPTGVNYKTFRAGFRFFGIRVI